MEIGPVTPAEFSAVVNLWRRCGLAATDAEALADIRRSDAAGDAALLVARDKNVVCATVMAGFDGHRAWVYYVATAPDRRGEGLGRQMMAAAEDWARARGAPKLMLMTATSNPAVLGFYERLGFEVAPVVVLRSRLE